MKLLGSIKNKLTEDNEGGADTLQLEITEVELVYCNTVNNGYQHDARVLYTFFSNKSLRQLLDISPKKYF